MVHLKKGIIYKITHEDVEIGRGYRGFTALSNCIIFSPYTDMDIDLDKYSNKIYCDFLITFDKELRMYGDKDESNGLVYTSFHSGCIFSEVTSSDILLIVNLFKEREKYYELANYLKGTNYRYNRKLKQLVEI